jgi:hypothetical protein
MVGAIRHRLLQGAARSRTAKEDCGRSRDLRRRRSGRRPEQPPDPAGPLHPHRRGEDHSDALAVRCRDVDRPMARAQSPSLTTTSTDSVSSWILGGDNGQHRIHTDRSRGLRARGRSRDLGIVPRRSEPGCRVATPLCHALSARRARSFARVGPKDARAPRNASVGRPAHPNVWDGEFDSPPSPPLRRPPRKVARRRVLAVPRIMVRS